MNRLLLGFGLLVVSSILSAQSIELTWVKPELREDGTAIQSIDRFNIYHTFDNVIQDNIEAAADDTSYTVFEAAEGVHTFQISTVEDGLEGEKSDPISAPVLPTVNSRPAKMLVTGNNITVQIID